ncbi:putative HNHc nuclease [Pediococcus pentosaceus]|uniref:putative HNHc nuclease n=1 Tax=Pediococcus pentosaceus TaxID=1255 RepID=UPI001E5B35A2|nr:putative HNHc nuclease [Pediococcus pentosaceus]MCG7196542.1 putative HNHc nuclease [Pediococcus pentosaceus]MCI2396214.1 putative HNHc nuclease [Pediococcus pentosaceus]
MQRARAVMRNDNLIIHLDEPLNQDHLETVAGSTDQFYIDFEVADTRKARVQQRRLFFALLHDIEVWSFTPKDYLKEIFYTQYEIYTAGKEISLADSTKSSVSDANTLLDLVIDFMFEWRVPFKKGYELLPRDQRYFLYQCCRHRVCTICSKRADIHHIDVVGRTNRNKVDHTKRHVMALCREHHIEIETINAVNFAKKYHVPVTGIKLKLEDLKELGIKGKYEDEKVEQ